MKSREQAQKELRPWAREFANRYSTDIFETIHTATQELGWYTANASLNDFTVTARVMRYSGFLENPNLKPAQKNDIQIRKALLLWVLE